MKKNAAWEIIQTHPIWYTPVQRVPALRPFWDLEKTVLHEIRVSGTVVSTNEKIPHLHVHKPKTVLVIFL